MAKSDTPFGWKWVTIRRGGKAYRVMIRDKECDFSVDPDNGDILDNDVGPGEVERFVSDTEMWEALDDKERELEKARQEAERLNKEQELRDKLRKRDNLKQEITDLKNNIKFYEDLAADEKSLPHIGRRAKQQLPTLKARLKRLEKQLEQI